MVSCVTSFVVEAFESPRPTLPITSDVWALQCSLGARSVGPQGILRSAPRKTAQTCCALVTATGMTVAVRAAGTLRAYSFRRHRLRTAREKDDRQTLEQPLLFEGLRVPDGKMVQ
jgi:hypothetical protein